MRNIKKSLIAAGLTAALAAAPFAQVAAQNASSADQSYSSQSNDQNQTIPGKANDAWITTKVKSELATTKHVSATAIDVDTNDGHVTLSGTVDSQMAKDKALRVAQNVKGVKSVDITGLTVGGTSNTAQTGTYGTSDSSGNTAYNNQDHGQNDSNQTMIGHVNDGWVTTKVKSELASSDQVKASNINVDTSQGHVRLTGTVDNAQALNTARQVAQNVKGVRSVDTSGLTVTNQRRTADTDNGM